MIFSNQTNSILLKMKLNLPTIILFLLQFLFFPTPSESTGCNRRCGTQTFPFPFGFSAACHIHLNCSSNGTALAADFAVQSITADTILINLPANCSRPVEALDHLFTQHYAPSSLNAVLLQNCSAPPTPCFIPTTAVMANFEQHDCGEGSDSISCYSEKDRREGFLNHGRLRRSGCRSLFSAISMDSFGNSSVSLDVEIVRMEWWLPGECSCSDDASCVRVSPPLRGNPAAHRCRCAEGFVGDGFREGFGCRPSGWSGCNVSKYLSGQCGGKSRIIVLVGGVAVVGTVTVCLVLLSCFIRKRSKLMFRSRGRRRHQQLTATPEITIPIYSYREIEKATDSFSEKRRLGDGAYGTVYSAKLANDQWVAVKRIRHRDSGASDHVINEIKLISSVNHPNLVRLLGCSIDTEPILVYEFMPNGTLSHHLQRQNDTTSLPWRVRLAVVLETARALSYLHNAMRPPIYHRDVKSSNILLDYDYGSKLADFGLSRLGMTEFSHVSTAPQGTPGYVDPQYHQHFYLSDKSDVYSFGVVLVEIMTAMKAVDFDRPPNEINLAAMAVERIGRGRLDEIIDPLIERDWGTVSSVLKVGEVAFRCLCFEREMRPSMMEVVAELEQIKGTITSASAASSSSIKSPVSVEDSWRSESSPSSNS